MVCYRVLSLDVTLARKDYRCCCAHALCMRMSINQSEHEPLANQESVWKVLFAPTNVLGASREEEDMRNGKIWNNCKNMHPHSKSYVHNIFYKYAEWRIGVVDKVKSKWAQVSLCMNAFECCLYFSEYIARKSTGRHRVSYRHLKNIIFV